MTSNFAKVAANYVENGFSVVPIQPGEKRPGWYTQERWYPMAKWNEYFKRLPSQEEMEEWLDWPDAGIGLLCGRLSGVIALDFDYDVGGIHKELERIFPPSPCIKKGAKGYTAFYRYSEDVSSQKFVSPDGQCIFEVLSDGRQTVMPPTLHPEGMNYHWVTPDVLEDAEDLPIILKSILSEADLIIKQFYTKDEEIGEFKVTEITTNVFNLPDENWRSVNEKALLDLEAWVPRLFPVEQLRKNCNGYRARAFWRGGDGYNIGITISGIQDFAREGGMTAIDLVMKCNDMSDSNAMDWLKERLGISDVPITIVPGGNLSGESHGFRDVDISTTKPVDLQKTPKKEFPSELLAPTGLLGDLVSWINETAIHPQPVLSLGASICAIGTALAHKVRGETNLRTNMLIIGTAESGAGKDHARKCIKALLSECGQMGLHGGERIASSTGLFRSVMDSNGVKLFQLDEIGRLFSGWHSKKAAYHQADIGTMIMEMFSSANTTYFGTEYADPSAHYRGKKRGNHDDMVNHIEQPCLNIYGTTVPARLFDALSSREAVDGFLSRWLVFHASEVESSIFDGMDGCEKEIEPPGAIVEGFKKLLVIPTNVEPRGNLDDVMTPRPRVMRLSGGARGVLKCVESEIKKRCKVLKKKKSGTGVLWSRALEHTWKLAMIASAGHETIGEAQTEWAWNVVKYCVGSLADEVEDRIADNLQEEKTKRILRIIKNSGTLSATDLYRRTKFLTERERKDIIQSSAQHYEIEILHEKTSGRPKVFYKWNGNA